MILPAALLARLATCLGGTPAGVTVLGPRMACATICGQRVVVKWAAAGAATARRPDACTAEARGLQLLAAAGVLRVPQVHAQAEAAGDCPAFLVLEWIDSGAGNDQEAAGAALGTGLAALHRQSAPAYGLDHDNYCGATPQVNAWRESWLAFYRDCRLSLNWSRRSGQAGSRLRGAAACSNWSTTWTPGSSPARNRPH